MVVLGGGLFLMSEVRVNWQTGDMGHEAALPDWSKRLSHSSELLVCAQGGFKPIVEFGSKYLNERPRIL